MNLEYGLHLLWIFGVILLQWGIAGRILLRNARAILLPTLLIGTYYSLSDVVAIRAGIWHFDENMVSGITLGPVPIEEVIFFFATALLVAQSIVMFLPVRYRR